MKKKTLNKAFKKSGRGLHTGKFAHLRVEPSQDGMIKFIRQNTGSIIHAHYKNVVDTKRGVTLANEEWSVRTVEHLLSALYGMGVDSCNIFIDGEEVPALDGSSLEFADIISDIGLLELDEELNPVTIKGSIRMDFSGAYIEVSEHPDGRICCSIEFNESAIGTQHFCVDQTPTNYIKEIAPARTFIQLRDVEHVLKMGKAKGGSLENTVVYDNGGVYKNMPLRFTDEPVRHKILDLIGDFALLGRRIKGSITAYRTGHTEHITFLKKGGFDR